MTKINQIPPDPQSYDIKWMCEALTQAETARDKGEVPVGAVLTIENRIIASGYNSPIKSCDPTAHAEIMTLRKAAARIKNYRLTGTTLYVTLEPCIMCMGAIIQARIERLVFGATDPKGGAAISCYSIGNDQRLNHSLIVDKGILAEECSQILKLFFKNRRTKNSS